MLVYVFVIIREGMVVEWMFGMVLKVGMIVGWLLVGLWDNGNMCFLLGVS